MTWTQSQTLFIGSRYIVIEASEGHCGSDAEKIRLSVCRDPPRGRIMTNLQTIWIKQPLQLNASKKCTSNERLTSYSSVRQIRSNWRHSLDSLQKLLDELLGLRETQNTHVTAPLSSARGWVMMWNIWPHAADGQRLQSQQTQQRHAHQTPEETPHWCQGSSVQIKLFCKTSEEHYRESEERWATTVTSSVRTKHTETFLQELWMTRGTQTQMHSSLNKTIKEELNSTVSYTRKKVEFNIFSHHYIV